MEQKIKQKFYILQNLNLEKFTLTLSFARDHMVSHRRFTSSLDPTMLTPFGSQKLTYPPSLRPTDHHCIGSVLVCSLRCVYSVI